MKLHHALRLVKETCALRHLSLNTEKTHLHWIGRYASDIYGHPTRLIVHLLYGCGLRVSEPLNLRIKDIDWKESRLYLYQAKGGKGRAALFPNCLAEPLKLAYLRRCWLKAPPPAPSLNPRP